MFEKILNDANLKWGELTSPENIWIESATVLQVKRQLQLIMFMIN